MTSAFHERIDVALSDLALQKTIQTATSRFVEKRAQAIAGLPPGVYERLREQANRVKRHTADHLDYYLEQLESKVVERGGKVIWCYDGDDAARAAPDSSWPSGASPYPGFNRILAESDLIIREDRQ